MIFKTLFVMMVLWTISAFMVVIIGDWFKAQVLSGMLILGFAILELNKRSNCQPAGENSTRDGV